jgi:CarD family transcriptional regulator
VPAAAKEPALRTVKGGANPRPSMPPAPASIAPAVLPSAARDTPAPEHKRVSGIVPRGYVPLVDIPKPPPPPRDFTLKVGDKAVHPSHGLAEVTAIEHREIGSMKGEFYILRILDDKGSRLMVPRASSAAAGIRPVMSAKEADRVLETMKAREVAVDLQPWSRRFRAYTEMIQSGSPHEVAKVLRDMYRLKFDKDLSFGERRLLDQAKSLLMKELAAAKGVAEPVMQAQVDDMFRA